MRGWSSETDSRTGIGGIRVGVSFLLSSASFSLQFLVYAEMRGIVGGKKGRTGKKKKIQQKFPANQCVNNIIISRVGKTNNCKGERGGCCSCWWAVITYPLASESSK